MHIVVLGPHRSGTSVVTRLINLMGAYVGEQADLIGANDENPHGFWERKDLIACNDAILAQRDSEWDCLAGWDMSHLPVVRHDISSQMQSVLRTLGGHSLSVIKDPRLCLTLPCWLPYLNKPVAVIVYRDPLEVARSLHKRNGLSLQAGLAVWEYSSVGLLNATQHMPRILVKHADIVQQAHKTAQQLHKQLEAAGAEHLQPVDAHEIADLVEPQYYRSKVTEALAADVLNPHQQQLMQYMTGEIPLPATPLAVSYASIEAMRFHSALRKKEREESKYEVMVNAYAQLQASYAQLEIKQQSLQQQLNMLQQQLGVVENVYLRAAELNTQRYTLLQRQLDELYNSTSWRIVTFPARLLRRLRNA